MLKGKTILLCVSGGIAAYKAAYLASSLVKLNANVKVLMTNNATKFITPLTFEHLTSNKCIVNIFEETDYKEIEHISLANNADLLVVAPATANICAKLANGIADDMITTTALVCKCPKLIAPAMNTNMFENPITQKNIKTLKNFGWEIINPEYGKLACGIEGIGKLADPNKIIDHILKNICFEKDLENKNILVTAGPTREYFDPVRFITNNSTGKMGYAIAKNAMLRGANVTLITGPTSIPKPSFINTIEVSSSKEMFEAVKSNYKKANFIFKVAAVCDYTTNSYSHNKIKKQKDTLNVCLEPTTDILKFLGENKLNNQIICGFSMETENTIENSKKKLIRKNIDMICANNLNTKGAGFNLDTNVVTIITKSDIKELPLMSKENVAREIINYALKLK